ncbi:alpha-amylase [Actinoplanes sp. CA-142083]|uniref:alpha-amylase family glycosyl hydrolase n=1 Tax=Actinoplanes sp. CA-142083 TaxID=3239903 RepID=UPI003D8A0DFE
MTTGWPSAPVVYEIDTWPWMAGVAQRLGHPVTLADVPDEVWDETLPPGIDAVWLMGVWERSPAGLVVARANEELQRSFHEALPGMQRADLAGSPYCVRRYRVDEHLGGPAALATARAALARRGLRLVLDYVPNHVAPDHPAVVEEPSWFIQGDEADESKEPVAWFRAAGRILAHGRDPYFPPWPDVAQLNAFSPGLREATAQALADIAGQCDGLRCDMAMLLTNDVFARTWGAHAGPPPSEEFWPSVIARLRRSRPDVVLIAEAYWDMEWTLQQQGFDFCYDKRLYDRLAHDSAAEVRGHLAAGRDYQDHLIRFIENHDEPRAASALPGGRDRAAAVAIATLPGATLWHEGEFEGRRTHLPVFLGRFPDEPVDADLHAFYHRLLAVVAGMRRGEWTMLDSDGWPDNPTHADVIAWAWHDEVPHHVVAINLSDHPSQARIAMPWPALAGRSCRLLDLLDGRTFDRDGDSLVSDGLYVDLPPWGQHLFAVTT